MNEKGRVIGMIRKIRSDLGREFENETFSDYYEGEGLSLSFLLLKLHSRMELLNARTEQYKRWLE